MVRHQHGWNELCATLRGLQNQGRKGSVEALRNLRLGGGVMIKGENYSAGGIGADPGDVEEFLSLLDAPDQDVVTAVRQWISILTRYPTPRHIARTGWPVWSQSTVLGFNKPAGQQDPPWLLDQFTAFKQLVASLDDKILSGNPSQILHQHAIDAANALTTPGGAMLVEVPSRDRHGPRQASIDGPGAHPDDVKSMIRDIIRIANNLGACLANYVRAITNPDVPYNVRMISPGPAAVSARSWLNELQPSFKNLLRELDAYILGDLPNQHSVPPDATVDAIQQLLTRLRDRQGVKLPDGYRLEYGGPGISPLDLLAHLKDAGYNSNNEVLWHQSAHDYHELTQRYWSDIPRGIRLSGSCKNRANRAVLPRSQAWTS